MKLGAKWDGGGRRGKDAFPSVSRSINTRVLRGTLIKGFLSTHGDQHLPLPSMSHSCIYSSFEALHAEAWENRPEPKPHGTYTSEEAEVNQRDCSNRFRD